VANIGSGDHNLSNAKSSCLSSENGICIQRLVAGGRLVQAGDPFGFAGPQQFAPDFIVGDFGRQNPNTIADKVLKPLNARSALR